MDLTKQKGQKNTMRVVTFKKGKSGNRIGIIHGDKIADLRATFEKLLAKEKGIPDESAKDNARKQIPDSMIDLINRGDNGITCIKQAYEFLNRSDEKGLLCNATAKLNKWASVQL
jgi:hypothetical protein